MELVPLALFCVAAGQAATPTVPPAAATPSESYTVVCTFTNPAFSGTCSVSEDTPRPVSPQAACRVVLACLNSDRCVTKTYCNATTVRSGWRLVTAREAPRGSQSPAPSREPSR